MHVPLQSIAPVGQPPPEQRPAVHDWPAGQARPQPPQLAPSTVRLAQLDPHSADPVGQAQMPACASQTVPPVQLAGSAPQLLPAENAAL